MDSRRLTGRHEADTTEDQPALITGDPESRRVEDLIRVVWLDSLAT